MVLDALGRELMQPGPADAFAKEFARSWAEKQAQTRGDARQYDRELKTVDKRISHLIDALAEGIRMPDIQTRLAELERRRSELHKARSASTSVAPLIPPDLASVFQEKLAKLRSALAGPENTAALEIARGLIDRVVVNPPTTPGDPPDIELIGDLANMLKEGGFGAKPSDLQAIQVHLTAMLDSSVKEGADSSLVANTPGCPDSLGWLDGSSETQADGH